MAVSELSSRCVLVVTAVTCSLLSCSGALEPCDGIELGERIRITILDSHTTGCGEQLGLIDGTELTATITDFGAGENQNCTSGKAEIDIKNDWHWTYVSEVN